MITKLTKLKLTLYFLVLSLAFILLFLPVFINRTHADIPALNPNIISCTCVTNSTQTCVSAVSVDNGLSNIVNSCDRNNGIYNVVDEFPVAVGRTGNFQSTLILDNGNFVNGTANVPYLGGFAPYTGDYPCCYLFIGYRDYGNYLNTYRNQKIDPYSAVVTTSLIQTNLNARSLGSNTSFPCRTQNTNGSLHLTGYAYYASYEGSGYPGDEWNTYIIRGNYSCY